nr:phosphatidyl glycerophosphate phosphatase [Escherichia coli]
MTDKIQDACGNHPGDNIVDHDPHAAMHIAIKPADRPRLPHIQNTENHKPGGNPLPVIGRQRHERDPHTNKFVPDNAAMIVHTHVFRRLMTKIDADTDPQHHHQRVELPGQKGHQIPERNRCQRPIVPGTIGLNPLPNPTASRCHGLLIFRRLFATSLWRGKMVISFPV